MSNLHAANLFDVAGKRALITGGGSGLGEQMATALCANGAHVFIAARKEGQLKEVSERLTRLGPGKCEYIIGDVGSKAGCEGIVSELKKRTCVLNVLVNNSGVTWGDKFDSFDENKGWDRVLAVNVKALFYMTVLCAPLLTVQATATSPGRIINISSVAGLDPKASETGLSVAGTGLWSYNTSKAAANHLTSQLAVTLGPKFVTVNAICPGVFPSKMTAYALDKSSVALNASHPMGRVGSPEDITGTLMYLVSRAGAHTTGAHLALDGGALISGRGYSHL